MIEEKKWDDTPEDEARHDVTDQQAAFNLAGSSTRATSACSTRTDRPTKNVLEQSWIDASREKTKAAGSKELLSQRFALMR